MLNEVLAGRYRITDLLGSGGMGQVWSAQDVRMRRDVAVKVVHPQHGTATDEETRARFEREVQLAGRLAHQNIVTVHDWGEVQVDDRRTTLFLVMELVRGDSLHRLLKGAAPTPWPLAVGWAAQIAQALEAAHGQSVVHRDIKPANVLLTGEGAVKVLDFGVAKFMGETLNARDLTVTGAPLGSPMYMSPEQAEGARQIDHRSDLYSLGCLLYHAVTGRPPFTSDVQWAVLRMQMQDTPTAPATHVEGLPAALDDLVLNLLAKRPEDRPADAAAVHDSLTTILADQAVTLSGGQFPDLARLGHDGSVAGRILGKARERWQRTEAESRARHEEATLAITTARAEADRLLAEARERAERRYADAAARADRLVGAAEEAAARSLADAESVNEQRTRAAEAQAAAMVDEAAHEVDTHRALAERIVSDARSEAARIVADARTEARRITAEAPRITVEAPWIADAAPRITGGAALPAPVSTPAEAPAGDSAAGQTDARAGSRFDVVRQGYDTGQVDLYFHAAENALATAETLLAQLEQYIVDTWLREARTTQSAIHLIAIQHKVVMGRIADAYDAADRGEFPSNTAPTPAASQMFATVPSGYHRRRVDRHLKQLGADQHRTGARISALRQLLESIRPRPELPQP
ncbi:serine/threonine-protein kinase [Streptomyces resistomycificus]|uniref:serine/threonine-protein kinase n=1 Tax=Streptomyces resistomycificus TaxID=67356 RepID=UPI00068AF2C2|nr:serine/threonine-protein kinase [Streptomyces resistomycificus]KUN91158.1 hypothetical protein AQJ84_36820 [Streptomyces resistomycificus]